MAQSPDPSAVAVPTDPSIEEVSVTVLLASAVPARVGVVSLVMSSSEAVPVSLEAVRSGALGAAGLVVSMVTARPVDAAPVLPAASVAVAVSVLVPAVSVPVVNDQSPDPSAVAVPTAPSTSEVTAIVLPASAVPETVSAVLLVMSSSEALPVSLAASRSGVPGAAGLVVSMVTARAVEAALVLPATSIAAAVRE